MNISYLDQYLQLTYLSQQLLVEPYYDQSVGFMETFLLEKKENDTIKQLQKLIIKLLIHHIMQCCVSRNSCNSINFSSQSNPCELLSRDDYVFNASKINVNQEWVSMTDFSLHTFALSFLFELQYKIYFLTFFYPTSISCLQGRIQGMSNQSDQLKSFQHEKYNNKHQYYVVWKVPLNRCQSRFSSFLPP